MGAMMEVEPMCEDEKDFSSDLNWFSLSLVIIYLKSDLTWL